MKRQTKQFLLINFIIGYLFFGALVYQNMGFIEILKSPAHLFLLIMGSLSSFFASAIVYLLNSKDLGGLNGMISEFKIVGSKKSLILIPIFLTGHYFFGLILNNIIFYKEFLKHAIFIPVIFLVFASQEIGWRKFVQLEYENEKGYSKSIVITGLFWSLWFLPLIFIRGFIVMPQFFVQFAMYLIGISFLLASLYRNSKSVLYSSILLGLIFALAPLFIFKQNYALLVITILEAVMANSLKDKKF